MGALSFDYTQMILNKKMLKNDSLSQPNTCCSCSFSYQPTAALLASRRMRWKRHDNDNDNDNWMMMMMGRTNFINSFRGVRALSSSPITQIKHKPKQEEENGGFVEEMRRVAMKLHTPEQAKEGQAKEDSDSVPSFAKWKASVHGFINFLVDSSLVFRTLETVVHDPTAPPTYAEFRNSGLERGVKLSEDLEWLKSKGYEIPEPSEVGLSYAKLLKELADENPPAFICHFYNIYFAHSAGGRMIGKMVSNQIFDGRDLEFYKWARDLPELLAPVKQKLNKVAEGWSSEEKKQCLQETAKSFQNSTKLLRLIIS